MTIQLNPTTSDAYESKSLLDLRQKVFDKLGFIGNSLGQPGYINATVTLKAVRDDIYNMLGMAAMPVHPPGVDGLLNSIINEAQQTAYRRIELATLSSGAPPLLVSDTDNLTVDPVIVRMLALGTAKAHYGKEDGAIYLKQAEEYFKNAMQRCPPNAVQIINRIIKDAQITLYRIYKVFRMERWFTWTFVANQRFYGIASNDERLPLPTPTNVTAVAGTSGSAGTMIKARQKSQALSTSGGQLLFAGGSDGFNYLSSSEVYNPTDGTFAAKGDMITPRQVYQAATLQNGSTLIAGGFNGSYLSAAEIYNPATGTFAATGSMTDERSNAACVLLNNGTVLLVGGNNATSPRLATAEIYNPATGLFTATTGNLTTARTSATATVLGNGKVLIAGGQGAAGEIAQAEIYDPATGTFTVTGSMVTARHQASALLLGNGLVLIAGGLVSASTRTTAAETYNHVTGLFTATGSMSTARNSFTLVKDSLGKILAAGGESAFQTCIATAEIYDATAGTWSATTGSLSTARAFYAVQALANGFIGIFGGEATGGSSLASVELYNPSTKTFSTLGSLTQGVVSYRVTAVDKNGKQTLPSVEVSTLTIPTNTPVVISWDAVVNSNLGGYIVYGRTSGAELRLAQVDASTTTYTDYGVLVPSGAMPIVNGTGNVGPILDQRQVSWVGISQGDVGWRPLIKSVPPVVYSNQVNGIPQFYDIREAIEVWPAPMNTSWQLRVKGYFTLGTFDQDGDVTTIDWQAVYLKAVADAKVMFKQPDAQLAEAELNRYIGDLVAGSHGTQRYMPGARAAPNAVRPVGLDINGVPLP